MGDIQFSRGYVNEQAAQAGRFGQRAAAPGTQGPDAKAPHETAAAGAQDDGTFGFDDFLDIINPLQHIPVVSTLYRELTGDEISAPARIFGGTLFGGPSGFVSAVANTFFDEIAGEDVGASVLAFFGGGEGDDGPQLATPGSNLSATDQPASDLPGDAFSAAPLVTATGRATPDPTGPDASTVPVNEAIPETGAIPAGLLPLTAPPRTLQRTDSTPPSVPPAPAGPLQHSGGPESRGGNGVLTGQDALSALFNDLRGGAAAAPPLPSQTRLSREAQPASQDSNIGRTSGLVVNSQDDPKPAPDPATPDAALADQMLLALDKYQAMTRQRGLANPPLSKPDLP